MNGLGNPVGLGDIDVMDSEPYKRAVYRPPPSKFMVEMLGAAKQGSTYSFGMRISAINPGYRSSVSSQGSLSEYEVWRRWEDCLWFQGILEVEYQRMARDKRQRLLRGKGVKKNGFYKQDHASSFESLPPGPDPRSVAQDIHAYIPALTRKATLFRTNQATVDQRALELKALVEAIFQHDVPALVDELRQSRIVTDFFGYWRRDYDLAEKQRAHTSKPRASISSSNFSKYFSASSPNITDPHNLAQVTTPSKLRPPSIVVSPNSRNRKSSTDSSDHSPTRIARDRASSTTSSDSLSILSDQSLDSPVATSAPDIADDMPVIPFHHNPLRWSDPQVHDHASSSLAVLAEEHEPCLKDDALSATPHPPQSLLEKRRGVRNGRIFLPSPDQKPDSVEPDLTFAGRSLRESWQTIDSAVDVLEGIDLTLASPTQFSYRASMSSISSVMTHSSADAVIPRTPEAFPSRRRNTRPRVSGPVSISEYDIWSDTKDGYSAASFPLTSIDLSDVIIHTRPETMPAHKHAIDEHLTPPIPDSPIGSCNTALGPPTPEKLSIKAGYNDSMIMLRVPWDITYEDVRQRLYNKFVGQEGMPLSNSFKISYLWPSQGGKASDASDALSSEPHQVHFVTSQADWENVTTAIEGSKLTLRITDNVTSST